MKKIVIFILLGIASFFLLWIYSPEYASKVAKTVIPKRFLEPALSNTEYTHYETDFLEQLKLIHGEYTVNDSCIYTYSTLINNYNIVVNTKGKVNFYVNIDTSIIQINNNSKTFLIDTSGIKLQYFVSDYSIDYHYSDGFKPSEMDMKLRMADCNAAFEKNIENSSQLTRAKKSLDDLINNQLIFLIQKGYENKSAAN